jgi:hypothetical protein
MFTLIHTFELAVIALLAYGAARIYSLSRNEFRQLAHSNASISGTASEKAPESATMQTSKLANIKERQASIDDEHIIISKTKTSGYENKIESLKEAQIFAGIQMIPVKREFEDLQDPQLIWLREAISLYLVGAIDFIGKNGQCDQKTRTKLVSLVLGSTLKLNEFELRAAVTRASSSAQGSDEKEMILAGAKAANQWLKTKNVVSELRLRTQLNDWGVFA